MIRRVVFPFLAFALSAATPALPCTLWSANGAKVSEGGSLIVKNRDWTPTQHEKLVLIIPRSGYRYIGLDADGARGGIKAGINEKGLVVVSASVSSIPAKTRRALPHTLRILRKLLAQCASVDDALAKTNLFMGPEILMLADKDKVATVEIGPDGKYAITSRSNAVIYHTNHYLAGGLLKFNERIGKSSLTRYARIARLLAASPAPYDFDKFSSFSDDRNDGPDESIFRTGSTPKKIRTLATWAVKLPQKGSPELYVRLFNPGEKPKIFKFQAADIFNGHGLPES